MKCFYHSADLDGHCSGAIIRAKYPECVMIGTDYNRPFNWDCIGPDEIVYMVDMSLQPFDRMVRLADTCGHLVWIDHHKTAMDDYSKCGRHIGGLREIGKAACELVWEYFSPDPVLTPAPVYLLGRYDVFDLEDDTVLHFQYGMRALDTDPADPKTIALWETLLCLDDRIRDRIADRIEDICCAGRHILNYINTDNGKYARSAAFSVELDGMRCIAINKMATNSQLFDSVWNQDRYDAMLAFGWRNGGWVVSLYSDKPDVDVSRVAKNHGGGGHANAAGFHCRHLPFALLGR